MTISGEQVKQLHQALLSAFPGIGALRIMVRTGLGENLESIAGGANLSDIVYALIQWAEAQGRLKELVRNAHDANRGNPDLHRFAEAFLGVTQEPLQPVITQQPRTPEVTPSRVALWSAALQPVITQQPRTPLSPTERRTLFQQLNALPPTQLDELIFTLNPPPGSIPSSSAAQGSRVAALLQWAEGTGGCGLAQVRETLEAILNPP